jgi:polyisoprenoid-binding protein YceI
MRSEGKVERDTQTTWLIDAAHTTIEFTVKKLWFLDVKGNFDDLEGNLMLDESDICGSSVTAAINAASVETGNKRRDAQLRSADFLRVDRYPYIRFQSTRVEPGRDRDTLRVTGSLTVREKSREVLLDVNEVDRSCSPGGEQIVYYTAQTELDRFDFGIDYWRGLIGRKLKVAINLQASRHLNPRAHTLFRGASAQAERVDSGKPSF